MNPTMKTEVKMKRNLKLLTKNNTENRLFWNKRTKASNISKPKDVRNIKQATTNHALNFSTVTDNMKTLNQDLDIPM